MLIRRYQRFSDTLSAGRDFKLVEIITATQNTDVMTNVFSKERWSYLIHETVLTAVMPVRSSKYKLL